MKFLGYHDRRKRLLLVVFSLSLFNFFWIKNFCISNFCISSSQEVYVKPLTRLIYNLSFLNDTKDFRLLVNLTNFSFLINNKRCDSISELFMVVFVHSAPKHYHNRQTIRQTWGQETNIVNDPFRVVFLIGQVQDQTVQLALEEENHIHQDIIQGNFIDSYRNLTYKYVMGLKWVTYYCRHVKYVFKADDDIFVNIFQLVKYLKDTFGTTPTGGLVLCYLIEKPSVKRSQRSKWHVSFTEYPWKYYPPYCSGWAVVMSPDVIFGLYIQSSRVPYFWVDDVHVSGTLVKKLGVSHTDLRNTMTINRADIARWLESKGNELPPFGRPDVNRETIHALWTKTLLYYNIIETLG
ncbi:beta-1,3-galactosyltransferase 5-like [Tachypleus tridentatus]|uniref:beta-1,3-galactosyltransferase 5-like n=1 Tax=Tachypleus tridentatus TaxID=6853 RepID=UPI003FD3526B